MIVLKKKFGFPAFLSVSTSATAKTVKITSDMNSTALFSLNFFGKNAMSVAIYITSITKMYQLELPIPFQAVNAISKFLTVCGCPMTYLI